MKALTHATTAADAERIDGLVGAAFTNSEIWDFLQDPIGYGDYDFEDPITLGEFNRSVHFHGRFVAVLG